MEKEMYEYLKYRNKLITIKNCITIICFVVLAISFGKWWISLFAALFLSSAVNLQSNQEDEEE